MSIRLTINTPHGPLLAAYGDRETLGRITEKVVDFFDLPIENVFWLDLRGNWMPPYMTPKEYGLEDMAELDLISIEKSDGISGYPPYIRASKKVTVRRRKQASMQYSIWHAKGGINTHSRFEAKEHLSKLIGEEAAEKVIACWMVLPYDDKIELETFTEIKKASKEEKNGQHSDTGDSARCGA